ncbi:MAG: DUF115 domain-containing protein [Candidatus Daviesbacteria bacterium]|nr:DUF115 domain-containing protein [Candidatus Daviesbacteria bacterium]
MSITEKPIDDQNIFDKAVNQVEANTKHLYPMWMQNWATNLSNARYGESLDKIYKRPIPNKVLIVGAGPSLKQKKHLDILLDNGYDGKIIASDGALPLLAEKGIKADYSVTVDGSPIISKWFLKHSIPAIGPGFRAVLPVTVHPSVINMCNRNGFKIAWYIPELDSGDIKSVTEILQLQTISEDNTTGLSRMNGAGNSIDENSLVYTEKGPIQIKDLLNGDMVYSIEEPKITTLIGGTHQVQEKMVLRQIINVDYHGEQESFNLKTRTRSIISTKDHRFLCMKNGVMDWVELDNLSVGDSIVLVKKLPETIQDIDVSPDLMRLLGCYIGDGCSKIKGNGGYLDIALPNTQNELQLKYSKIMMNLFGKKPSIKKYRITLYSGAVAKLIKELGFSGNALTKQIPEWVFTLPKHLILCFMEGYIDADVSDRITKSGFGYKIHMLGFESPNKILIEQLNFLSIKIGWRTNIIRSRFRNQKIFNGKKTYEYNNYQTFGFTSYPESNLTYSGGYGSTSKPFQKTKYLGIEKIVSIEPVGKRRTYDITVDGTHNFVANGLATHNCGLAAIVFAATILRSPEISMIGMDSGYRQDTPLEQLHYHDNMLLSSGLNKNECAKLYKTYYMEMWNEYSIVDPVFEIYRKTFVNLASQMVSQKIRIVNCTEGGCLASEGVEYIKFIDYLNKGND